jgi:hypothetical protein
MLPLGVPPAFERGLRKGRENPPQSLGKIVLDHKRVVDGARFSCRHKNLLCREIVK